ncbi:MAG: four helix bundle protein [Bacteroidetes bacterium]|nr:four helix bundle protein [Bacteroidota bacterium]
MESVELFDFQKLIVYQRIRSLNKEILPLIYNDLAKKLPFLADQLKRATKSIALNLAEGVGRTSPADKRRFYVMSRSSLYECVASLDIFLDLEIIDQRQYDELIKRYTEVSKMLYGLQKKT